MILNLFKKTIFFFPLLICLNLSGQIIVKGKVLDDVNGKGLPFTNIALLLEQDSSFVSGYTANENGEFEIKVPQKGQFLLRFSFISYQIRFEKLNSEDSRNVVDFGEVVLNQRSQILGDAEVVARKPMYQYDNEKKVYNVTEDPSVQNGMAVDALQNSPGVYVDMEGNITLRGTSSVEIWLNDKPSRITGEGLKSFLQQLPANTLDRIEVITNPSARFSSEGNGGIINIITKEKIKKHFLLSGGFSIATSERFNPWLSFIWSKNKWSVNTYVNQYRSKWYNKGHSETDALSDTSILYSTINDNLGESNYIGNWAYTYVSYEADSFNSFDLWAGVGINSQEYTSSSCLEKTQYAPYFSYTRLTSYISDNRDDPNKNFYAGLSYSRKFRRKGHKLDAEFNTSNWGNGKTKNIGEILYSEMPWKNRNTLYQRSHIGGRYSADIDYVNPISAKRKLEAGLNINGNLYNNILTIDTLNFITGVWEYVPLFSDSREVSKIMYKAYLLYTDSLWVFSYKIGLRSEYRDYILDSKPTNQVIEKKDFNLFPSLNISWSSSNNISISASYSRRIDYPDYELNPFVDYSNEESISYGNPNLVSAFTDSYEYNMAKFFLKGSSVSISLYHRRTLDDINNYQSIVFDSLLGRATKSYTYINSGKDIFNGTEFTVNYVLGKYRCMFYLDVFNYNIQADFPGYSINKQELSYNGKLIFRANYKYLNLNASMIYHSSSVNVSGESDAVYYINLSASTDLFNRKLSVRLGVKDIFNWQENAGVISTPTLYSVYSNKGITRYLTFGVTCRFGKTELENKAKSLQAPMGG